MGIVALDGDNSGFLARAGADTVRGRLDELVERLYQQESLVAVPVADAVSGALGEVLDTVIADGSGLAVALEEIAVSPGSQVIGIGVADTAAIGWVDPGPDRTATAATPSPVGLAERVGIASDLVPPGDGVPLGAVDTAVAGVIEDWNVPDDATSVTGRLPWTRLAGTLWTVRNGHAALASATDSDGLQVAQCDVDLGTSDYELRGTLVLRRNDAALAVSALLARIGGAATFYQARAVQWAGGDFVDLWRTVAGTWARIGGPVTVTPQDGDQLIFHVSGSTLAVYLRGALLVGPIPDTTIPTGTVAGIFAQWSSGTQALVGWDDWMAIPLPFAGTPLAGGEGVRCGVTERLAVAVVDFVTGVDQFAVDLGESPIPTFYIPMAADLLPVASAEAGRLDGALAVTEPWGLGLEEAAVGGGLDSREAWPVGIAEAGTVGEVRSEAEAVGLGIDEAGILTDLSFIYRQVWRESVPLGLGESGLLLRQGFIQITREVIGTAGIMNESIGLATILNDTITTETG